MKGYITNIEKATEENTDYRRVLFTSHYSQLVLMCIKPGDEIGSEIHGLDQFIRFEQGEGKVVLDGEEAPIKADDAVVIPAGIKHNVMNTSKTQELKLYSIYSPPEHAHGTVHGTKAEEKEEHFDGMTSPGASGGGALTKPRANDSMGL
ncbi:MAG: cupin domain-containing protein [bacterium]|nr:cupin domain-containing protein [bacterium]